MEIEHKQFSAKVQSGDTGIVEALVSCFNNVDHAKEVVRPGAFKASLARKLPRMCWAHKWDIPIGKTLEARETDAGLVVRAQLNLDTTAGKEAYSNLKFFGNTQEWSIGYSVVKDSFDKKSGTRNLEELSLHEFSPVLVGMNPDTQTLSIKAATTAEEDMPIDNADEVTKANRPNFGGNPDGNKLELTKVDRRGIGQQLVESNEYKDFLRSHSRGSESQSVTLDVGLKTLMLSTTGWPVESTRGPVVVPDATRMPEITDVIPTVSTNQNAFVYMEHTTFTNAAAETAEGAAKPPEAALALTERTSPVRKIPVWIPVTDEQLEDVPGIQDWIESQLALMVLCQRLDTEIVSGSGITPNLLGIMNVVGVQSQAKGTIDAGCDLQGNDEGTRNRKGAALGCAHSPQ